MIYQRNFAIQLVWIALIVATLACGSDDGADPEAASVDHGAVIYNASCSSCHSVNAEGQPNWHLRKSDGTLPAPPLNGDAHAWHHGDGTLYRIVKLGGAHLESPDLPNFTSAMPAFGDQLQHEEIIAVITYLKSLWQGKSARGVSKLDHQAEISERDPFPTAR